MAATTDWTYAEWDETAVYDLTVAIVNTYLKELFGNYDFFTRVRYSGSPFEMHSYQTYVGNRLRYNSILGPKEAD